MSATAAVHPTDETLHSYGLSTLDLNSTETVGKHLEDCDICRRRVAEMSSDSFIGRLRDAHGQPGSTGPVVSSIAGLSMLEAGASIKAPPPTDTLPPGLADHPGYEVIRELGQGGMGTVYLAKNRLMGRHEVLKVVSRHMMNRPGALERFLVEIRNAARLHHTNVVTAYSATRIGESLVFAMEYVDGLDLSKLVKAKGPLPVSNACNYVHQAALGLQHASELGMVHRDIKPGNLMLAKQGNRGVIKVLDFGLAKVKSEGAVDGGLTHDGQMLGTPDYVAPEQIRDARRADIRADIYSLGCTFYCLLTGGAPFHADNLYEILQAHHSMDAMPLNLARPEVPIELAALVARMMAKEPEHRFQTPKDVAQALLPFFRKGIAAAMGPKAEVPQPGGANQDRASTRVLSVSTQHVTPTRAPSVTPLLETQAATSRTEPTWESLIKFKETEPPAEPAQAVTGSARLPRWIWPSVSVGGMVLALIVASALVVWFKTSNGTIELVARSPEVKGQVDDRSARSGVEKSITRDRPPDPPLEAADKQDASGSAVEPLDIAPVVKGGPPTANAPSPAKGPPVSPDLGTMSMKAEFQPLFNGKDLTGWKTDPRQPGNWQVENRVLVGYGPSISHLYTKRDDFKDFHLRIEARFNKGGRSGVFFRCPFGAKIPAADPKWPDGFEATINDPRIDKGTTGGLYPGLGNDVFVASFGQETRMPAEQWFTLEVIADGNAMAVLVNGKASSYRIDGDRHLSRGHIALQKYSPETWIEFRRIEIKELNRWNQKDPEELSRFPGSVGRVTRVAFSPDGLRILWGGHGNQFARRPGNVSWFYSATYSMRWWDVATERNLFEMGGGGLALQVATLSSDGQYAASAAGSLSKDALLIWDLKSGKRIHRFSEKIANSDPNCTTVSFSPDDRLVMAALRSGSVLAWDLVTEQQQPPITLKSGPTKQDEFPAAAFSHDRRCLVTGRQTGLVELWDLQSGQRLQAFAGHTGVVRNVACSPDGRHILSGGIDRTVRLWDAATGKELRQLKCDDSLLRSVVISPDSRRALTADLYGLIRLWDLASGKEVCCMEGHTMAVNSVAFSPNGRRAVSGSDDRTVRLWQLPD